MITLVVIVFGIGLATLLLFGLILRVRRRPRFFRRPLPPPPDSHPFDRKKPDWVRQEVIWLRALMPHRGCRSVATAFNSLNAHKGQTVGKTYVATVARNHALDILRLRNKLKNRIRHQGPRNHTWAMDFTFLGQEHPVLGIIDHGSRSFLRLFEMKTRTSAAVLRAVLDAVEFFGAPKFIRTDNEPVFSSFLMRAALWVLGIKPQTTDPHCPWQNGRIERAFLTLKQHVLKWWELAGVPNNLQPDLDTFRTWYNHARSHQSLAGLTPAMAWAGITEHRKPPRFFQDWDGILTGFVCSS